VVLRRCRGEEELRGAVRGRKGALGGLLYGGGASGEARRGGGSVGAFDGGEELGGEAGWRRFGRGKVVGWASECTGTVLEEGRRHGGAGGGRDAAAGAAREEGEGDWGGRSLK
jgi:hypothetical protein